MTINIIIMTINTKSPYIYGGFRKVIGVPSYHRFIDWDVPWNKPSMLGVSPLWTPHMELFLDMVDTWLTVGKNNSTGTYVVCLFRWTNAYNHFVSSPKAKTSRLLQYAFQQFPRSWLAGNHLKRTHRSGWFVSVGNRLGIKLNNI